LQKVFQAAGIAHADAPVDIADTGPPPLASVAGLHFSGLLAWQCHRPAAAPIGWYPAGRAITPATAHALPAARCSKPPRHTIPPALPPCIEGEFGRGG